MSSNQTTSEGWIDWRKCKTREMILEDLAAGLVPLDTSPEEAWNTWYSQMVEVQAEKVVFSQFKERFIGHVKQVSKKKTSSIAEQNMHLRHRDLHPIQTHDAQGQLIFEQHESHKLLEEDVKNRVHKRMSIATLRMSRPQYQEFTLKEIRKRIPQMERRVRYLNWLEDDRKAKARKQNKRFQKATGMEIDSVLGTTQIDIDS